MSASPGLQDFLPLHGELFAIATGDAEALSARLVEIEPLGRAIPERGEAFSLLFLGPAAPPLAQSIYQLRHPRLAPLDVFLVPIAADATGVRYEAIFA